MKRQTFLRRNGIFAAACLLMVTMSGCGGGDRSLDETSDSPSAPQSTSTTTTSDTESTLPSSTSVAEETEALIRAGQTGLEQVSNSTVYSIESEQNGAVWAVAVVTSDGTKHEMYISGDGRSVVQAPKVDGQSDEYRQRIEGAKLDFEQAVNAILDEVPGVRFKELGLDTESGIIVWEADVLDEFGVARSLEIDAVSGDVLANKLDT